MRTVAFYSYKGGTGRTLALANIARFAARAGKKVLAIDMDLEAPGLAYKLVLREQGPFRNRGLVGSLLDTIQQGEVPADIGAYVVDAVVSPKLGPVESVPGGWLKLVPAGVAPSPNYFGDLRALALDQRVQSGAAADVLHRLFEKLREELDPDLVLIDSRTGITNTNTLVLSELADAVFAFFLDLPEQTEGVRMVLRALSPLARDPSRPLGLNAVVARVPLDDEHHSAGWVESTGDRDRRERLCRFLTSPGPKLSHSVETLEVFLLHHEPRLVGHEELLLDLAGEPQYARSALLYDYHRLAGKVIDDPAAIERFVQPLLEEGEPTSAAIAALLTGRESLRATPQPLPEFSHDDLRRPTLRGRIEALRSVASRDPAASAALAAALVELAAAEREIGGRDEVLEPAEEAVTILRGLADKNPALLSNLADALSNLGVQYGELGRPADALAAAEEAVSILHDLVATDPALLSNLAHALNNVGVCYSELGRAADALPPTEEAVTIYRDLAATNPAVLPNLAAALSNLGRYYGELGRPAEALVPAKEATEVFRGLSAANPAFIGALAATLRFLSTMYSALGEPAAAAEAAEEAGSLAST